MEEKLRNITSLTHITFAGFVRAHQFIVVHFWAIWNGYDVQMRKMIESEISDEFHEKIHFATLEIDPPEHHAICQEHQVLNVPALAYFRDSKLVETIIGLHKPEVIVQSLKTLLGGVS